MLIIKDFILPSIVFIFIIIMFSIIRNYSRKMEEMEIENNLFIKNQMKEEINLIKTMDTKEEIYINLLKKLSKISKTKKNIDVFLNLIININKQKLTIKELKIIDNFINNELVDYMNNKNKTLNVDKLKDLINE